MSGFPNRPLLLKVYASKYMIPHLPHAYYKFFPSKFYILLTVHIGTIGGNNQQDALFNVYIYFTSLHVPSNPVLIIRRINCINTSSAWYAVQTGISDSHLHREIHTRWCFDTIDSPDDEHWVVRNIYRSEINTLKSASSWLLTRITLVTVDFLFLQTRAGNCTLYNTNCTLYNANCTLYNTNCTLYNTNCTLYNTNQRNANFLN
jgi:hypothetical protein